MKLDNHFDIGLNNLIALSFADRPDSLDDENFFSLG